MITTVKVLDDIDKKILKLAGEGLTVKEMAPKVEKSPHTISIRIREMKKYYRCKNLAQLVKTVSECG